MSTGNLKVTTQLRNNYWPWLAIATTTLLTIILLRWQGRLWICSCGYVLLWISETMSADNSQHIADPYSFSHILHGFIFYGLLVLLVPKLTLMWRLWIALLIEAAWEVAENTQTVIQRYREVTMALGYEGDSIVNSLGDLLFCGIGFWLACKLGFWRTFLLYVLIELVLLFWIRDNLFLNVLMLLYPIEAIQTWQMGG